MAARLHPDESPKRLVAVLKATYTQVTKTQVAEVLKQLAAERTARTSSRVTASRRPAAAERAAKAKPRHPAVATPTVLHRPQVHRAVSPPTDLCPSCGIRVNATGSCRC